MRGYRRAHAGFTLVEVLVALSIGMFVAGIGLIMSWDAYRGTSLRADRDLLVALLQHARAQAIHNVCVGDECRDGVPHGVSVTADAYILYQGAGYAEAEEQAAFPAAPALTRTVGTVAFARLTGTTTGATFIIADETGRSSTVTVSTEGRITWTN
ncbi:prepilin-type N-terminal cleavage/methylation domain-containing protein [Candidatus Kaiserbacteria bacterium]|nr:prepilin-type N-terminal cleavage/methylation domain-containing protein [Candidatus Kaiserbacteria bacterium]